MYKIRGKVLDVYKNQLSPKMAASLPLTSFSLPCLFLVPLALLSAFECSVSEEGFKHVLVMCLTRLDNDTQVCLCVYKKQLRPLLAS